MSSEKWVSTKSGTDGKQKRKREEFRKWSQKRKVSFRAKNFEKWSQKQIVSGLSLKRGWLVSGLSLKRGWLVSGLSLKRIDSFRVKS